MKNEEREGEREVEEKRKRGKEREKQIKSKGREEGGRGSRMRPGDALDGHDEEGGHVEALQVGVPTRFAEESGGLFLFKAVLEVLNGTSVVLNVHDVHIDVLHEAEEHTAKAAAHTPHGRLLPQVRQQYGVEEGDVPQVREDEANVFL
jgi:hypothetical protein